MGMRIAVAGLGVMGRHHARVLGELDEVTLVGVADPSATAEAFAARRIKAQFFRDVAEMLDRTKPDALVVAVPTQIHHSVASFAIESGIHVLVEKPIAYTSQEGADLVAHARKAGTVLAVGHIERFNPAVTALAERLARGDLGRVYQVTTRRHTPFPSRIMDCGVTVDLATHDIDLMRFLLGTEPEAIYARTTRRIHSTHEDFLVSLLTFPDNVVGLLEADWLTPQKIRSLTVTGERGMFVVEHLSQELSFYQNNARAEGWKDLDTLVGVVEGNMTRFAIPRQEPLLLEMKAFISAVAGGSSALASAEDGLAALRIAESMLRSADMGVPQSRDTMPSGAG